MLLEEIKNIKSEKRDLRNFGLTIGVALSILGALLWWKGKDTYTYLFFCAAVFLILGLIVPAILKPLQKGWMAFAVILGYFMTRLILSILFYFVFTSIGLTAKMSGRKFLDLKMDKARESYWIKRKPVTFERSRYEKQF